MVLVTNVGPNVIDFCWGVYSYVFNPGVEVNTPAVVAKALQVRFGQYLQIRYVPEPVDEPVQIKKEEPDKPIEEPVEVVTPEEQAIAEEASQPVEELAKEEIIPAEIIPLDQPMECVADLKPKDNPEVVPLKKQRGRPKKQKEIGE